MHASQSPGRLCCGFSGSGFLGGASPGLTPFWEGCRRPNTLDHPRTTSSSAISHHQSADSLQAVQLQRAHWLLPVGENDNEMVTVEFRFLWAIVIWTLARADRHDSRSTDDGIAFWHQPTLPIVLALRRASMASSTSQATPAVVAARSTILTWGTGAGRGTSPGIMSLSSLKAECVVSTCVGSLIALSFFCAERSKRFRKLKQSRLRP